MDAGEKLTRAVLFADIVDSVSLYRQLGDASAESRIRTALNMVAETAQTHCGRVVKFIGDCVMCEFDGAENAAATAVTVQRQKGYLARFRIAFNQGNLVQKDGDLFGDVVNVAARLCKMAKADQILTTRETGSILSRNLGARIRLFDKTSVKGISGEIVVAQLVWEGREATKIVKRSRYVASSGRLIELTYSGGVFPLAAGDLPFTIGRDAGCKLVVASSCASRCHVRIELHRGKCVLIDESTNGTYIVPEGTRPEQAIYVRNEAFTLLGRGVFVLGENPVLPNPPGLLNYVIS